MKVALVPFRFLPDIGGVETVVADLAVGLNRRGHEVIVLAHGRFPTPALRRLGKVRICRLYMAGPARGSLTFWARLPRALLLLSRQARSFKPDLVHIHSPYRNQLYAVLLARMAGCPLLVTFHALPFTLKKRLASELALCAWCANQAVAVSFCYEALMRDVAELLPLRGPLFLTPNGVPIETFAALPPPEAGSSVLAVGRLAREKGHDILLQAWAASGRKELRLLLAGDGPMRASLERMAQDLGLADRVVFLGQKRRPTIARLLGDCKLFVLPSRHEGQPLALLEAMAAARPIVATRTGGVEELLSQGGGLLVPPDNHVELGRAMALLLEEQVAAKKMGEAARRVVERRHTLGHMLEGYLSIYHRVADAAPVTRRPLSPVEGLRLAAQVWRAFRSGGQWPA
jgi:glycosyltransferase involved in cell wall biosynthesis